MSDTIGSGDRKGKFVLMADWPWFLPSWRNQMAARIFFTEACVTPLFSPIFRNLLFPYTL